MLQNLKIIHEKCSQNFQIPDTTFFAVVKYSCISWLSSSDCNTCNTQTPINKAYSDERVDCSD